MSESEKSDYEEGNYDDDIDVEEELKMEEEQEKLGSQEVTEGEYEIIYNKDNSLKIDKENYSTPKFMTKYEKARVIGTRALQISKNAPVMVDLGKGNNSHNSSSLSNLFVR